MAAAWLAAARARGEELGRLPGGGSCERSEGWETRPLRTRCWLTVRLAMVLWIFRSISSRFLRGWREWAEVLFQQQRRS